MFDISFGFAAALLALPLAGAPILLHLLFRQKTPTVQFSTLRFIKLSIQRTAARRKVQKWLLLACRALLLALLIWAIAQPAHKLTSSWTGGARSVAAAVVVDTSYSMQLQDGQVTLLGKADGMVQEMLRGQLAGAKVALFKSAPAHDPPEQLRDASAILADWVPLKPQPGPKPLVDRVAAAIDLLNRSPAEEKWIVVISDFQAQEFSHPMPDLPDGRVVMLDLHPKDPRNAGVSAVNLLPSQPIPGVPAEASVEVTGRPGDESAVKLAFTGIDGVPLGEPTHSMAVLDSAGRAKVAFPAKLPAQRWVLLTASLTADDQMGWDNTRSRLIEVPPRETVGVMQQSAGSLAERFVKLVLDPSEGKLSEWPLAVQSVTAPAATDGAVVAVLSRWPSPALALQLRKFGDQGRNIVLFLAPGLENSWAQLPSEEQQALLELLPSAPIQRAVGTACRAALANESDPILQGLTDEKYQLKAIVIRELVPLAVTGHASTILNAVPIDPQPGSRTQGLLFRKGIGPGERGTCYTFATLPDPRISTLATHPTFLPLMVRMALRSPERSAAQNVEIGKSLVLQGAGVSADVHELQVESPQHEIYRVPELFTGDDRAFTFNQATEPGLYIWRAGNGGEPVAISNVTLPAAESDLVYRPALSVAPAGPNTIVAADLAELNGKINSLSTPQPQWSIPLAIVMFLLCLEALMGSWSKMWRLPALRGFSALPNPVP